MDERCLACNFDNKCSFEKGMNVKLSCEQDKALAKNESMLNLAPVKPQIDMEPLIKQTGTSNYLVLEITIQFARFGNNSVISGLFNLLFCILHLKQFSSD